VGFNGGCDRNTMTTMILVQKKDGKNSNNYPIISIIMSSINQEPQTPQSIRFAGRHVPTISVYRKTQSLIELYRSYIDSI